MGAQAAKPEESGRPWDGVLRREIAVELRVIDEAERSVEVIASTEALDSHGDVVKQFWDLDRYNKNGAVLWNHNIFESSPYAFGGAVRPEDVMPVGKGSNVQVAAKKLTAKLTLVKGSAAEEPFIDKLWRRISQGVIKAVSVGFRPGEQKRVLNASGGTDHYELGSAENPNELVEISFVPMGSNPEAVAKSIAWERRHLDESTAANAADESESIMAMTPEEKQAFDAAVTAKGVAESAVRVEADKAKALEVTNTKLVTDLDTANKALSETRGLLAKSTLDALQGVKFAPAEREEMDALVKDIGVERVQKMLEKRAALSVTEPIVIEGKGLPAGAPAPASVVTSGNGSADLAAEATKGI
jgi:hypothetical protein